MSVTDLPEFADHKSQDEEVRKAFLFDPKALAEIHRFLQRTELPREHKVPAIYGFLSGRETGKREAAECLLSLVDEVVGKMSQISKGSAGGGDFWCELCEEIIKKMGEHRE